MKNFLRILVVVAVALLAGWPDPASALVVRPAPNISWVDSTGRSQSLAKFRGQPVVVVVATSPRDRLFRAQVGQLQKMYERYAAQRVVFIAAFTQEPGRINSNIPFALAADGPSVAHALQIEGRIGVALIGLDGNLDYVTDRVLPAQRIFDVIANSFAQQERIRRP